MAELNCKTVYPGSIPGVASKENQRLKLEPSGSEILRQCFVSVRGEFHASCQIRIGIQRMPRCAQLASASMSMAWPKSQAT